MALIIPKNYTNKLDVFDTQKAIKLVKECFQEQLSKNLNLSRVSAPLYVKKSTGLNDNLNGYERPVSFDLKNIPEDQLEVVHSLAKWKRLALKNYEFWEGNGLYTDMNAIRRDEDLDNLHSSYVDQWDWEKVINDKQRTIEYLEETVTRIVHALKTTEYQLMGKYPILKPVINDQVFFITSQELLDKYPNDPSKEREYKITKEKGTVFIKQIGDILSNGESHDGRAPDYDDWQLNGDLLIYSEILDQAIEISSMGIRVNPKSLERQLTKSNSLERLKLPFHSMLINNQLPLTIGGGIGQSRICMLLLQKAHIGEVQVSIWPDDMIEKCQENNINLL